MKVFSIIPAVIIALALATTSKVSALDFSLDGFFDQGASQGFANEAVIDQDICDANNGGTPGSPCLIAPISLGFLPDNRMLVLEKGGQIVIADPESGQFSLYLDISDRVNSGQERGLLDIAIAQDFDANIAGKNLIYLFYTRSAGTDRAVIASFVHIEGAGGLASSADAGTEDILWTDTDGFVNCCHYGGGLDFGPDGKIWLTSSDKFNTTNIGERPNTGEDVAADLERTSGKIIRINRDGTIPDGTDPDGSGGFWPANPYFDGINLGPYPIGQGIAHPSIWAYGLRNPFRAAWDAQYGYFYIGEVGGNQANSWDDIHLASLDQPGAFYGWNFYEGESSVSVYTLPGNPNPAIFDPNDFPFPDFNLADPTDTSVDPNGDYFSAPIFAIPHTSLTGGFVYRGTMFPEVFDGVYFYGNYLDNYIKFLELDPTGTAVVDVWDFKPSDTIPGAVSSIVFMDEGVDGALYYVNYSANGGAVQRIVFEGNVSPSIDSVTVTDDQGDANDRSGPEPLQVTFGATVSDTDNPPGELSYEWSFGDGTPATGVPTATGPNSGTISATHTYNAVGYYSASLRVSDGITSTLSAPVLITVGDPNDPPQILSATSDVVFGDPGLLVTFTAEVTDPDVDDPPESLGCTWDFGDGTPLAPCTADSNGLIVVQHTYNDLGVFNASLEISDAEAPAVRSNDIPVLIGAASQLPVLGGLVLQLESIIKVGISEGTVTSWLDESGFGNNLTAEGDPQYVANATGSGLPAIVFDGVGDSLVRDSAVNPLAGLPAGSEPRTMFFVVDYEDVINGEYAGLAYGSPANNQAFGLTLNGNTDDLTIQAWGGGNDRATTVDGVINPATGQQRGFISHAVVFDGIAFTHYLNGTAIASGSKTYNTVVQKLLIGQNLDGGVTRMSVAAAFIYDRALTPSEFASVEAYIQNIYLGSNIDTAPNAFDDVYYATSDRTVTVPASTGLLSNDIDDGPMTLIEINGQPVADGALVALANGSLTISDDGAFSYTPAPGFSGAQTFNYTVSDVGGLTATAGVTINVIAPGSDVLPVIDGLVVHLESDSNVIQGTGVVTSWLSGAGTNMDLVASGDPVLVQDATPSGQAAISLDGDGDKLERTSPGQVIDAPAGNAPRSMYFVVDYKATNGAFAGVSYGSGSANGAFGLVLRGINEELTVQGWGTGNDFAAAGQNGIGNNDGSAGDDWFVHSVRFDGTTIRHYRDNQLIDTKNHQYATLIEKFVIGEEIAGLGFSALDVAAVLAYDKELSDTEHDQTIQYLTQKYFVLPAVPDVVVRLPFEEGPGSTVAGDVSGNGNDGQLVNGALFAADTANGSAYALALDGTDDFVDLGTLSMNGSGLTLAAWFKADSFASPNTEPRLISKATGPSGDEHVFMLGTTPSGGANRLRGRIRVGGTTETLIADSGDLVAGEWRHAALTHDGATMRLYLDGVEVASVALAGAMDSAPTVPVAIGAQPPGAGGRYLDGLLDDAFIAQRALSAAEIAALAAALRLVTSSTTPGYGAPGDTIDYDYLVSNIGKVPLAGPVSVTDGANIVTCPAVNTVGNFDANLDVGEALGCTASYTVTQADIDAGSVTNLAVANAGGTISNSDGVTVDAAALTLVTSSTTPSYHRVGDPIDYAYTVTNSGSVTLAEPLTIADDKTTASCAPSGDGDLDVGEVILCTAVDYLVTQADIDAGFVTNTATASAAGVISNADGVTINFVPALSLAISSTMTNYAAVNDAIDYSYTVTNVGNEPLAEPLTIADDRTTASCAPSGDGFLAVGEEIVCTAIDYLVTQADIDAGFVTNTATASADGVSSVAESMTVNAVQSPALTLVKSTTSTGYLAVGDTIDYSYTVTNSGNVTLAEPVTIADDKTTASCALSDDGDLDVNETVLCTALDYVVTQADIDARFVTNIATASAAGVISNTDSVTVEGPELPALTLDKSTTTVSYATVGDVIDYSYTVTNTGNVPLDEPVTIVDDRTTATCPSSGDNVLSVGEVLVCTAIDYVVTQADIDAGSVINVATASAAGVLSNADSVTVPFLQLDVLTHLPFNEGSGPVAGDVSGHGHDGTLLDGAAFVADTPDFSAFALALDGVDDVVDLGALDVNGSALTLAAWFKADTFPRTSRDPRLISKATSVSGNDHVFMLGTIASGADTVLRGRIRVGGNVTTLVATSGNLPTGAWAHAAMTYDGEFVRLYLDGVEVGNTPLTGAVDQDPTVSVAVGGQPPGAGERFFDGMLDDVLIAHRALSAAEIANLATPAQPALTLEKSTTTVSYAAVGDAIDYSYTVTNSGNVPLAEPLTIADDKTTASCALSGDGDLDVNEVLVCTAIDYLVTQADIDAGFVTNTATASADGVISNADSVTVNAVQSPALALVKSTTSTGYLAVGDTIDYSYAVTNSGNVTLAEPVTIADDKTTASCAPSGDGDLDVNETIVCTAVEYVVTQDDIDVRTVTNIATASADGVISNVDSVTVDGPEPPVLTLEKSTTTVSYAAVGDLIDYSYTVTNTGTAALAEPVTIDDDKTSATCPASGDGLLVENEVLVCTAQHAVTQADIDAGFVTNTATASADSLVSNVDRVTVDAVQSPALTLVKSTTSTGYLAVGDTIDYSYSVTNTGNVTLAEPVTIVDDKTTASCAPSGDGDLDVNEEVVCTAVDYVVTQADIDARFVTNIATASAAGVISNADSVTVEGPELPALTLDKATTTASYGAAGEIINYSYTVTNSGNVELAEPVTIADDKTTATCPSSVDGILSVGEALVCTAQHAVTQADINAGSVTNIATASAAGVTSNADSVTVGYVQPDADLLVHLPLNEGSGSVAGDESGNDNNGTLLNGAAFIADTPDFSASSVALDGVNDVVNLNPLDVNGSGLTLAAWFKADAFPGTSRDPRLISKATGTSTDAHVFMLSTIASGTVTRLRARVRVGGTTKTLIASSGNLTTGVWMHAAMTYDGTAIRLYLDGVQVGSTPLTGAVDQAPTVAVAVGGQPPGSGAKFFDGMLDDVRIAQRALSAAEIGDLASGAQPALTLDKSTSTVSYAAVGDLIDYSYTVTNSGNVPLAEPVTIADDKTTASCAPSGDGVLAVGEVIVCTAVDYVVTQADIDAGSVTNTATASAAGVTSNLESVTVDAVQSPALSLVKSTSSTGYLAVGETIDYSYSVTNSGNVTLAEPLTIDDDKTTASCAPSGDNILSVGEVLVCTAQHVVTQADIDAGSVTNIATASAAGVISNVDSVTVLGPEPPALTLEKSTSTVSYAAVGEVIDYTYTVTNTGTAARAEPVTIDDDKTTATCPSSGDNILSVGEVLVCTAQHVVTQADIDAGSVTNIATASADGEISDADSVTVNAVQSPALTLVKSTTSTGYAAVGDGIEYSYEVTNSGNVTLAEPLTIADDKTTATCPSSGDNILSVGEVLVCTAQHVVTQADIDAGSVTNIATASADGVVSNVQSVTVDAAQSPALTLVKSTSSTGFLAVGETIDYSYSVTNSGNVTLAEPVTIADDKTTASCAPSGDGDLDVNETVVCTAVDYVVTQADIDAGLVTNNATASAAGVISNVDSVTVLGPEPPALTLDKSTTTVSYAAVGNTIDYSYTVTNIGNVALDEPVTIDDDKTTATCPSSGDSILSVGEELVCTAQHVVTQADIDAGFVTNTATASADGKISNVDSVTVNAVQSPALSLIKSTTSTGYLAVGESIDYSYSVTNSGNVTLAEPVTIADDKTTASCASSGDGDLDVNETVVCTAVDYVVTQADIDAGSVTNIATASAAGVTSNADSVTVEGPELPALTLDKSTTTVSYSAVGNLINYSYTVTNSGNVQLAEPVTIADDKATATCPSSGDSILSVGEALVCTAQHVVTQADINAGSVTNIATASAAGVTSNADSVTVNFVQPDAALLVRLPFNEGSGTVAGDVSGKNNNGTLLNGAAFSTTDTPDGSLSSVALDGVNDYVNLGNLDLNGSGLTLAASFKVTAYLTTKREPRLISKATGTSANEHVFMLGTYAVGTATRLRARVRIGGTTKTLIANTGNLTTGVWRHAAVTHDGTTLRLFLNGVQVGSTPLAGIVDKAPTVPVAIGGQPAGAGLRYFNGKMDNVRILQRALSAAEIGALAAANN